MSGLVLSFSSQFSQFSRVEGRLVSQVTEQLTEKMAQFIGEK